MKPVNPDKYINGKIVNRCLNCGEHTMRKRSWPTQQDATSELFALSTKDTHKCKGGDVGISVPVAVQFEKPPEEKPVEEKK